ncbi:hypothetical protein ACHAW5_006933 [Stephanodiscus triporus]|uniref:PPM-type phosphatase domain-containing protein n=1 Tax=Stephanodiscus triporus TaxID=2934178 RepID=A0ABD3NUL7_9STRA
MSTLSLIKRVIKPNKSAAKKSLLKRDGIKSDGDVERDDDSSSLSDRQENGRSKNKKKFDARKFFSRSATKNDEEDDGFDSSSQASSGSTRSTSSSFLRYQNRAIWKARLRKNTILQRLGDGSETPVENEARPWPMFNRIYRRQNQLKKGDVGEERADSDDENDSVSSKGSNLGFEVEACAYKVDFEQPNSNDERKGKTQERGISTTIRSFLGARTSFYSDSSAHAQVEKVESTPPKSPVEHCSVVCVNGGPLDSTTPLSPSIAQLNDIKMDAEKEPAPVNTDEIFLIVSESFGGSLESESQTPPVSEETVQESGTTIFEAPKAHQTGDASESKQLFPIQKDTPSSPSTSDLNSVAASGTPSAIAGTPRRSRRQKKKVSADDLHLQPVVVPRSIPPTIQYSLRTAVGDGSVRQRNSHSLMDRRPLRPNGYRFVIEHIGSTSRENENPKPISLLAVFDGHGGSAASQFCSDWLSSYIRKKNDHFPDNIALAVKSAFTKIDSDFVSSGLFDGTTACAVTIAGKRVTCCNSGDSRAIIVKRDGSAVSLSEDHKPDRSDETKRINDLGGRVIHWGRWRVEGVLAVSRSIGDAKLKPYVTAEPEIVEHDIDEDDMFLVVASDGVWDSMSSDLVAKFVIVNTCKIVNKSLHIDETLLRWIARQVSKRARENGSSDNISCIVARLNY